jgi:hypothetical protein
MVDSIFLRHHGILSLWEWLRTGPSTCSAFEEGSTENATVFPAVLVELDERGNGCPLLAKNLGGPLYARPFPGRITTGAPGFVSRVRHAATIVPSTEGR